MYHFRDIYVYVMYYVYVTSSWAIPTSRVYRLYDDAVLKHKLSTEIHSKTYKCRQLLLPSLKGVSSGDRACNEPYLSCRWKSAQPMLHHTQNNLPQSIRNYTRRVYYFIIFLCTICIGYITRCRSLRDLYTEGRRPRG